MRIEWYIELEWYTRKLYDRVRQTIGAPAGMSTLVLSRGDGRETTSLGS